MDATGMSELFSGLTTPHVADACVRTGVEVRCAPWDLRALCRLHRDTQELLEIGLPIFSLGACPTGPLRLDPREAGALVSACVGSWTVGTDDVAMGDVNGALFLPMARAEEIAMIARSIRDTERAQAGKMRQGTSLGAQLQFSNFLAWRASNPTATLREHLRRIGGAIEE